MPSAWKDKDGWIVDFRPAGTSTKRRRTRVPLSRMRPGHEYEDAQAYAKECERYCRLVESEASMSDLHRALEIGAITKAQMQEWLATGSVGEAPAGRLLISKAAMQHPSSLRDGMRSVEYLRYVQQFCTFAGVRYVDEVTLAKVQAWIAHMRAEGFAWDTRRHRLLYVRRAMRMATTAGIPDPLAGFRLDRQEYRPDVDAWPMATIIKALGRIDDPRARAAVVLGACLGLRPSEIMRVQVGDLEGGILRVGGRLRKNKASRRDLPMPACVAGIIGSIAKGRKAAEPLIATARGAIFRSHTFGHWLSPILAAATGRPLPPKALRKAFASWAVELVPGSILEAFLGHEATATSHVSNEHYLVRLSAKKLAPHAATLHKELIRLRFPVVQHKPLSVKAP